MSGHLLNKLQNIHEPDDPKTEEWDTSCGEIGLWIDDNTQSLIACFYENPLTIINLTMKEDASFSNKQWQCLKEAVEETTLAISMHTRMETLHYISTYLRQHNAP